MKKNCKGLYMVSRLHTSGGIISSFLFKRLCFSVYLFLHYRYLRFVSLSPLALICTIICFFHKKQEIKFTIIGFAYGGRFNFF